MINGLHSPDLDSTRITLGTSSQRREYFDIVLDTVSEEMDLQAERDEVKSETFTREGMQLTFESMLSIQSMT